MPLDNIFAAISTELDAVLANGRPFGTVMKQKWIDADFAGNTEAFLRLVRRQSANADERKFAAHILAAYEEEQRLMKRALKQLAVEAMCRA